MGRPAGRENDDRRPHMNGGGVIVILKDFTFVGSNGQTFATDWISFPAEHKQTEYVVEVKSAISGSSLTCQLQGSYDTDSAVNLSSITASTAGVTVNAVTSGLTPVMRVKFTAAADSHIVLSIYVIPKVS